MSDNQQSGHFTAGAQDAATPKQPLRRSSRLSQQVVADTPTVPDTPLRRSPRLLEKTPVGYRAQLSIRQKKNLRNKRKVAKKLNL